MARKGTIDRLPAELRREIARLREEEGCSIDEIVARLRTKSPDVTISRSAMGRYTARIDKMGAILREAREGAEALVAQLGDRGEGDVQRLNTEMAQALLTRLMVSDAGEPVKLDPKEAMFLASAVKNLTSASRDNASFIASIEKRARDAAALQAKDAAKSMGISAELADSIAAKILGVAPQKAAPS